LTLSEIGPKGVIEHFFRTCADEGTEAEIKLLQEVTLNPGSPKSKELLTAILGPKAAGTILGIFGALSSLDRRRAGAFDDIPSFLGQDRMHLHVNLMSAMMRMDAELTKKQQDILFEASVKALAAQDADAMADEV
jgi:hypothetical protein